jgi:hypothetical protein
LDRKVAALREIQAPALERPLGPIDVVAVVDVEEEASGIAEARELVISERLRAQRLDRAPQRLRSGEVMIRRLNV